MIDENHTQRPVSNSLRPVTILIAALLAALVAFGGPLALDTLDEGADTAATTSVAP